jgi:hypothetical protein
MQADMPAIVDTVERTAVPRPAAALSDACSEPTSYQKVFLEAANKINPTFFFFGDSPHADVKLSEFYFSFDNLKAQHCAGAKAIAVEFPQYTQPLVDLYLAGKLKRLHFQQIIIAQSLYDGLHPDMSPEDHARRARAMLNGIDYATALGMKFFFWDRHEEVVTNFEVFKNYKNNIYREITRKLAATPNADSLSPLELLEIYRQTELNFNTRAMPGYIEDAKSSIDQGYKKIADAMRAGTASKETEHSFTFKRLQYDSLVADRLRALAKKVKGKVSMLYGFGHFKRRPGDKTPIDIDDALIKKNESVMVVGLSSLRGILLDFLKAAAPHEFGLQLQEKMLLWIVSDRAANDLAPRPPQ